MNLPGAMEIAFIILILVILFGSQKLPEIGKSIGKAIREFKNGFQDKSDPNDNK